MTTDPRQTRAPPAASNARRQSAERIVSTPTPLRRAARIDRNEVLRSKAAGLLYAQVKRGMSVAQGTLLACITDFHGVRIEEIRAPFDGEVLYVVGTPPISAGEPVAFIGQRAAAPPVASKP